MTAPDDRVVALKSAREVLSHLDHGPEELIVVAEWLLTGSADLMLAVGEQRARNYHAYSLPEVTNPDEYRWTPPARQDVSWSLEGDPVG